MGSLRVGQDWDFTFTFHFQALEKEMATHSSVLAWRILGMGAAIYGVSQSQTRLKRLSSSSSSSHHTGDSGQGATVRFMLGGKSLPETWLCHVTHYGRGENASQSRSPQGKNHHLNRHCVHQKRGWSEMENSKNNSKENTTKYHMAWIHPATLGLSSPRSFPISYPTARRFASW